MLGKSWIKGDRNGESRVIFGTLDFLEGKGTFQKVIPITEFFLSYHCGFVSQLTPIYSSCYKPPRYSSCFPQQWAPAQNRTVNLYDMTFHWGKNRAQDDFNPSNVSCHQIAICRAAPLVDCSSSTAWAKATDPSPVELRSDSYCDNDCSRSHIIFQHSRSVHIAHFAEQKPLGSRQFTHHFTIHKRSHVQSYKKSALRDW